MPEEIDFPRGGVLNIGPRNLAPKRNQRNSKENKDTKKAKIDSEEHIEENPLKEVFKDVLSFSLITQSLRGLGFIKKVREADLILECSEGILITVPANRISKRYTELLSSNKYATLDELYFIGQALSYKVIELKTSKTKSKPDIIASTCPFETNSHFIPSNFLAGLAVNGIISSIEEKGAIVDLGLSAKSNVTGFVQTADLPEYLSLEKLKIGQVILFRIKEKPSDAIRVIKLSAFVEAEHLNQPTLSLNQLTPGTIVQASPVKTVTDGVFIKLTNGPFAFIRKMQLPPRLRYSIENFNKPIRLCVMCCQQNSPLLILSGHPDVLAISQLKKRLLPSSLKIGDKLQCYVYGTDKQHNVYFRLDKPETSETGGDNRNVSLLTAKALRINIDDIENNLSKFSPGNEHTCKIIGYSMADRQLLLTIRQSHLNKTTPIALEEIKAGAKMRAVITSIRPNGLMVRLGHNDENQINGFISKMHVQDSASNEKNWQKGFIKGQKILCRVLYLDMERNRAILTAKPSLVKDSTQWIDQLSDNYVGVESAGVVLNILESGGLVIGFYNRITGLIHGTEATKIGKKIEIGQTIKVKVRSVDVSSGQMILDPVDITSPDEKKNPLMSSAKSSEIKDKKVQNSVHIKTPAKPFNLYTATVKGPWLYGDTSSKNSAELELSGGSVGRLHASELPEKLLSHEGLCPMLTFLERNTGKTVTVKVISAGHIKSEHSRARELLMAKHQTDRVCECTMNSEKVSQPRKKLKLINYTSDFRYGDFVPAFLLPSKPTPPGGSDVLWAEINPLFKAHVLFGIPSSMTSSETGDTIEGQKEQIIVDAQPSQLDLQLFEDGELKFAKVVGVNKAKKSRIVELSLINKPKAKKKSSKKLKNEETEKNFELEVKSQGHPPNVSATLTDSQQKRLGNDSSDNVENPDAGVEKSTHFCKTTDPGFDWSIAGFRFTDLAGISGSRKRKHSQNLAESVNDGVDNEIEEQCQEADNATLQLLGLEPMESSGDYDQKIVGNPNSSKIWISYMAFFLAQKRWPPTKRYDQAKRIAERALDSINYSKTEELFNIWAAYLNLEVIFGTEESLKIVFERACGAMDSFRIHKQLAKTYQNQPNCADKYDEICKLYETMLKKFKQRADVEIWTMYARYLMEQKELDKARQLMQRALQCAEKKKHVGILTQFAQLEKNYGDPERSKTMTELIQNYRKKGKHVSKNADSIGKS